MCFFFSFVVSGVNQFTTVYPQSYANSQQTHMKNSAQFHNKKKNSSKTDRITNWVLAKIWKEAKRAQLLRKERAVWAVEREKSDRAVNGGLISVDWVVWSGLIWSMPSLWMWIIENRNASGWDAQHLCVVFSDIIFIFIFIFSFPFMSTWELGCWENYKLYKWALVYVTCWAYV